MRASIHGPLSHQAFVLAAAGQLDMAVTLADPGWPSSLG
jgi:hypothetical protein